jgi:hypothetical protein|tara:strand:+ start:494 stop:970 length:477 start_codon:yes stop_codon:yes gene_type:complete
MKFYAYDSNCDLHHLGDHPSAYHAREAALEIFGKVSLETATVLSESQVMASAVTVKMMAKEPIKPQRIRPITVKSMDTRGGNTVADQYIINDGKGNEFFQSYRTVIARSDVAGNITLDKNHWNYSGTTGQYRNQFLNEGIDDTRTKINSGVYALANLN